MTMVADKRDEEGVRALRLSFAYDESGIRVIDRTPVDKRVPPSADEAASLPAAALCAELRTAEGQTTYRRVLGNAIPLDIEVFDPDTERGVYRSPTPLPSGAFSVVVPDDGKAEQVVLLVGPAAAAHPSLSGARSAVAPAAEMPDERGLVVVGRFRLR